MTTLDDTGIDGLLDPPPRSGAGDADSGDGDAHGHHAQPAAAEPDASRRRLKIILIVLAVLLAIVLAIFAWYLINRKPLSTLPGLSQEAMPHFSYSIYHVQAPLGVAVTPDGERIYVTQSEGPRVVSVFDRAGNQVGTLTPPKTVSTTHIPAYVAISPTTGQIWVTDRLTASVYVYDPSGGYVRTFTPKTLSKTWQPLGIAFDTGGNLYLTDVSGTSHKVLVFDTSGKLTHTITSKDPMSFPNGDAVDDKGNLVVADSNNGRVLVFDQNGQQTASVNRGVGNGDVGLPRGVAVDQDGRIFVVDTTNQAISVYRLGDKAGSISFLGQFGQQGIDDGMFMYPNGVATDQHARVYVTDRANNRVQVWSF